MRMIVAGLVLALVGLSLDPIPVYAEAKPRAYVFDHEDPWTQASALARLLREARFDVKPLPLDRSPIELEDAELIAFGSFASEHPDYGAYMKRYGKALYELVDTGRVLLRMTRADQTERVPPFLPTTHGARRGDRDFAEVILAGDTHGAYPALLEGAYGQGRILLSAMAFDKDVARPESRTDPTFGPVRKAFAARFFTNLRRHCDDVVRGKLDNTWHTFEASGQRWIVIALEWGPRPETIAWADRIMGRHRDRRGILMTHAYLNNNDRRYDHTDTAHPQRFNPYEYRTPGGVSDGEELWQKLVRKHRFDLVLNGHVLGDGTGYLASTTDHGSTCHQMLSNFQMREMGGEGYLRLLEFRPDGRTVQVKTYTPLYDRFLLEPDQQFQITLDAVVSNPAGRPEPAPAGR